MKFIIFTLAWDIKGKTMKSVLKVLRLSFLCIFVCKGLFAGTYSGGNGTEGNPYQIATIADLIELSQSSSDWGSTVFFVQTANIDFNSDETQVDWDGDGTASWDDEDQLGFTPIGNSTENFHGRYNGQDHTISNLYINRPGTNNVGLFGYTYEAIISHLGLVNLSVAGNETVGGLVGRPTLFSYFSYCYTTGSVTGTNRVGGIVGYNNSSGGFSSCFSTCNVSGLSVLGGFVGWNGYSAIKNCYCSGNVTRLSGSETNIGGFCGVDLGGEIDYSYSTSSVFYAGTSSPTDKAFVGAESESEIPTYTNNFFAYQLSNQTSDYLGSAIPASTPSMKLQSYFSTVGWDFTPNTGKWRIQSTSYKSLPYLQGISYDTPGASPSANPIPELEVISPTSQASSIFITNATSSSLTLNWTVGNGEKRAVFMKESSGAITNPSNYNTYVASNDWNLKGDQLGSSGYYCVYNGSGTSVEITNLSKGVEYIVQIFEYNGYSGVQQYYTPTASDNPKSIVLRYSGGVGTSGEPFRIGSPSDLISLSNNDGDWGAYFVQTADIVFDADETQVDWDGNGILEPAGNDGLGFSPIGNSAVYFTGHYDGQNHSVSNLYINSSSSDIGMFGAGNGCLVENLGLNNVSVVGYSYVGGLMGILKAGTITRCYATGSAFGSGNYNESIGGLVGESYVGSSISYCHSDCMVGGAYYNIGGLVGLNTNASTISYCYSTGSVQGSASNNVGGFVGANYKSTITNSYSNSDVSGDGLYFGGFVGQNENSLSSISNCYSKGDVIRTDGADTYYGGFCGFNRSGVIQHCYSLSAVNYSNGGTPTNAGFASRQDGTPTYTNNYFNSETSGQGSGIGADARTTDQMKSQGTYSSWDFVTNWSIQSIGYISYPYVKSITYDEPGSEPEVNPIPGVVSVSPTAQASAIIFNDLSVSSFAINWTKGNGVRRAVFVKEGTGTITNPSNGSTYSASADWNSKGSQLGVSGYYCVYSGTESGVMLTNIRNNVLYSVQIFEFNGSAGSELYNTNTAAGNPNSHMIRYSGGKGTQDDPYQIATTEDLIVLSNSNTDWQSYFIQTTDIAFGTDKETVDWDGNGTAAWDANDQLGFSPIGNEAINFQGQYNGQGYSISNLYINRPADDNIGLFGRTDDSDVQSIGLENVSVTGNRSVGGLVGYNGNYSTVANCSSSGNVNGNSNYVGGIVGDNEHSSINNSFFNGIVAGNEYYTGGIVGYNSGFGIVDYCYSSGTVFGKYYAGGLAGVNDFFSIISNSYSIADVIRASGDDTRFGGFCGDNSSVIQYCYSAGSVTYSGAANPVDKGFVGNSSSTPTHTGNYFDSESSSQTSGIGAIAVAGAEMRSQGNFADWDFSTVWDIQTGQYTSYPYLRGFTYDAPGTVPSSRPIPGLELQPPATQATAINFTNVGTTSFTINWTNGSGTHRTVFMKEGSGAIVNPTYSNVYSASAAWNSKGSELGTSDYFCVYSGNGNSVTVTGLNPKKLYTVQVFENNNIADLISYNTNTASVNPNSITLRFSGGKGDQSEPYRIASSTDLIELSKTGTCWGAYFVQVSDIAFNADETQQDWDGDGTASWDVGDQLGFSPIGDGSTEFTGNYNGQNNIIKNLYVNRSSSDYVGLWGYTNSSTIQNLGVINLRATGVDYVGGLVGHSYQSTINNCYTAGVVTGSLAVGGLVGYNYFGSIIANCNSTCYVSGTAAAGVFVGNASNSSIIDCYSTGSVLRSSGTNTTFGGFCGYISSASIRVCYSTGSIEYAGAESPTDKGFIGTVSGTNTLQYNYFDSESSGQASGSGASAKSTIEMKTQGTFTGWDFNSKWNIHSGSFISYPYLRSMNYDYPGTIPPVNPTPGLQGSCTAEVFVSSDYNTETPGWGLNRFNDLTKALFSVCAPGVVNISNYSHTGDIDISGKTLVIGDQDFTINGNIENGLIRAIGTGYLRQTPNAGVELVFPITDGANNYSASVTTSSPMGSIGIKINKNNLVSGTALVDFWDISGANNLNATLKLMIPKSTLKKGTWSKTNTIRVHNGSRYVPIPASRVTIDEHPTYIVVSISGLNSF